MDENMTPEMIEKAYSACLDSVNLIYSLLSKAAKTQIDIDTIKSNTEHLSLMANKTYWGNQDIEVLRTVIQEARAWLALSVPAAPPDSFPAPTSSPAPVVEDPRLWWVDEGPFKDRLGMDAAAIYASSHPVCKGVVGLISGRQYINLKDPRIRMMLSILVANAQPTADPVWPGSGPMTPAKIDAIVNTPTTDYERHIKGLKSN